jgi:hypothetical protein
MAVNTITGRMERYNSSSIANSKVSGSFELFEGDRREISDILEDAQDKKIAVLLLEAGRYSRNLARPVSSRSGSFLGRVTRGEVRSLREMLDTCSLLVRCYCEARL